MTVRELIEELEGLVERNGVNFGDLEVQYWHREDRGPYYPNDQYLLALDVDMVEVGSNIVALSDGLNEGWANTK